MSSGRAILMAVEGESSRLVEKHQCGIIAQPSNPSSLADAVRTLVVMPQRDRERMGQAGRDAYCQNYCSEVQIPKFERLLQDVVSTVARRRVVAPRGGIKRGFYFFGGKRVFDLLIACPLLALMAPIMLLIGIAVRLSLGSPVLFKQERPGLGGQLFKLYKFRTMGGTKDPEGRPLAEVERITPLGRFLRATSLDELPGLWNVLRGDMSLVGPRPLLPEYLPLYTPRQAHRHEVRPGITGLAQIRGRNGLGWEQKFEYDLEYMQTVSLRTDLSILLETIGCVIRRQGVNASAECTMLPFTGTRQAAENACAA
jgi:lipopolysaccharide/colanic/teichoic acid biosynthesis glycosyltransferase